MLSIAQRDGFDKCVFDRDALASIVKNTEITEEQAQAWARDARFRHGGGDDMEFFLRQENVPVHVALDFEREKVEFEREKAQMERERREDWQAVAERYHLLIQQLMARGV